MPPNLVLLVNYHGNDFPPRPGPCGCGDCRSELRVDPGAADAPGGKAGYSATPEFSPRLRALFVDDETYAHGQVGRLDFNPFSGANDDDIKGAEVTSEDVDGAPGRKVVTARFRNMKVDRTIIFFWERIDGLWYIDDIAGRTAGEPSGWTLSLILKYGQGSI